VARLLYASGYDAAGAVSQTWLPDMESRTGNDEHGKVVVNAIDPSAGFKVCIEKSQNPGAKYPTYSLRVGGCRPNDTISIPWMQRK